MHLSELDSEEIMTLFLMKMFQRDIFYNVQYGFPLVKCFELWQETIEVLVKSLLHGNNTFSVKEAFSMARRDCSMVRIDHGYG